MTKLTGTVKLKSEKAAPAGFFDEMKVSIDVYRQESTESDPDLNEAAEPPKYSVGQSKTVSVNSDGTFEIECITGSGNLNLLKGGQQVVSEKITTELGKDNAVELSFAPPRIAKGKVVDTEGNPVAGVRIHNAESDMGGEYQFEFFESNANWRVQTVPDGYLQPMSHGSRIDFQGAKPGEPIELPDTIVKIASSLTGKVVDDKGEPVENAKVVASWQFREGQYSTNRSDSAKSDSEGNFTLKSIEADVKLALTARTSDLASLTPLVESFKANSEPVEIVVTSEGLMAGTVKVRDAEGKPVEGAKVQVSTKTKSSMSSYGTAKPFYREECLTNADGIFEFPEKIMRPREMFLKVMADGYVTLDKAGIEIPAEGDLIVSDVVLRKTRTIVGSVVDSQGKPVADATVWSHGIENSNQYSESRLRPKGSTTTTDASGAFQLSNIHSDAQFVFASKAGSIDTGSLIADDKDTELVLRSVSEELESPVKITWKPSPESIKALEEHIAFVKKVNKKGSSYTNGNIIDALKRVGSSELPTLVTSFKGSQKAQLLASLGHIEDAIEVCQTLKSPSSRARAFLTCSDSAKEKADKIMFLEEAGFEVGNILQTPSRLERSSSIIDKLIDLGEIDTATALVNSIMPAALELNIEGRNEFSKAWFAKAAVRVDYENSWKLIEESKTSTNETSGGFGRHCGNMAHELAATDPDKAIELLREIDVEYQQQRYAPRVAYRVALTDPKKGIEILEEFLPLKAANRNGSGRSNFVSSYSAVATAIVSSDPEKAKELLRAATDQFEVSQSSQYSFGAALNLLVNASECGPVVAEQAFWKLVDQYSNPNIREYSSDEIAKSRLQRSSDFALLLGLTDRYPELRRAAVEKIYEAFKGEGKLEGMLGGSALTDLPTCFAAVAIDDPERAVQWHKKLYERIDEDARSYIPMPWVVISNTLSMDGKELSRYIANETMHQWVPGVED